MAVGLSNARDGAAAIAASRTENAAESAVHQVLYEMIVSGSRSPWLQESSNSSVIEIDGATVSVSVRDVSGLVDLNVSDESTLRQLTTALSIVDAEKVIAAIKAAKPITSYAALAALEGMTAETFALLSPYVTLFSRQSLPTAENAPERLTNILHLHKSPRSVMVDSNSIAGRSFRVVAMAHIKDISSPSLSAEILITGRGDQLFLVYDWSWRPS